jgi:hypothetical protein
MIAVQRSSSRSSSNRPYFPSSIIHPHPSHHHHRHPDIIINISTMNVPALLPPSPPPPLPVQDSIWTIRSVRRYVDRHVCYVFTWRNAWSVPTALTRQGERERDRARIESSSSRRLRVDSLTMFYSVMKLSYSELHVLLLGGQHPCT